MKWALSEKGHSFLVCYLTLKMRKWLNLFWMTSSNDDLYPGDDLLMTILMTKMTNGDDLFYVMMRKMNSLMNSLSLKNSCLMAMMRCWRFSAYPPGERLFYF